MGRVSLLYDKYRHLGQWCSFSTRIFERGSVAPPENVILNWSRQKYLLVVHNWPICKLQFVFSYEISCLNLPSFVQQRFSFGFNGPLIELSTLTKVLSLKIIIVKALCWTFPFSLKIIRVKLCCKLKFSFVSMRRFKNL